ncbi:MarR family transcriptional regulator [Natronosalvus caseinilyticus]|uniref:MarR family transcriptional regulator n=1 Tax=Natronosalvus caseinilyticus TaxID=2953747 RepID=UPI0028B26549|nr:helix-turn-helix domain-containing protein [Natronosalvus caseinilyticus]
MSNTELSDLPPSAKLVYKVIELEGELTQKQLIDETLLSPRTVRYALERLESIGVIEEETYFRDARQSLYRTTKPTCTACE